MEIIDFARKNNLEDEKELNKIKLLSYYKYKETKENEFLISDINKWLSEVYCPQINISRATNNMRISKEFSVNKKTKKFSITLNTLKELEQEVLYVAENQEETDIFEKQSVLNLSIVNKAPYYIKMVVNQVNICYENGAFDACAVMIRKIIETLIIEAFERKGNDTQIKNGKGDFLFLKDLINEFLKSNIWNIGRNTKQSLPKLKDIGDLSAHNRRYIARKSDIDKIISDFRVVVEELVIENYIR